MQAALTENVGSNEPIECPCCGQMVTGKRFLIDEDAQIIVNNKGVSSRFQNKQFKLAKLLVDSFPRTVTKEQIYDNVLVDHAGEGPELKVIDVMICKIRPDMAALGLVIETVWGKGYRLLESDPEMAREIMQASVKNREKGSAHRWKPHHDTQLADLMGRGFNVSQSASIMKLPYTTIERHMKMMKAKLASSNSTK